MLDLMRQLALDSLWEEIGKGAGTDPEAWYAHTHEHDAAALFPKLVEDIEGDSKDVPKYYTLGPSADPDVAVLDVHDLRKEDARRLPFISVIGNRSAPYGPLIKRTTKGGGGYGPTPVTQQTTLDAFQTVGQGKGPWAYYFAEAVECWRRPRLKHEDAVYSAPQGAYSLALARIKSKGTVLLAYCDPKGRLPGDVPEYLAYLQDRLAVKKYATDKVAPMPNKVCVLCGCKGIVVYPNALRGAGINFINLDRLGAFARLDDSNAWKRCGLCQRCADLLYVYARHEKDRYWSEVAGSGALVIPAVQGTVSQRLEQARRFREWVADKSSVEVQERRLLRTMGGWGETVVTVNIVWAKFGAYVEEVTGVVADVLPSRLDYLDRTNSLYLDLEARKPAEPPVLWPRRPLDEFRYDVELSLLGPLLRRPGGARAKKVNKSRRLFELRRDLAQSVYHSKPLPGNFWAEVHVTAQWHWDAVIGEGKAYRPIYEGHSNNKSNPFTLASWVRQLAKFQDYLRRVGVQMDEVVMAAYEPRSDALRPYFGSDGGLNTDEKRFTFALGALYGKMMQVQRARGVNVGANALTWLRRLTLSGSDLPELYGKIRNKLFSYGRVEQTQRVQEVIRELGHLGRRLGNKILLSEIDTCYFLLLGQSLALEIMPSQGDDEGGDNAGD